MIYFIVAWIAAGLALSLTYIFGDLDENGSVDWIVAIMVLLLGPLVTVIVLIRKLTKKK